MDYYAYFDFCFFERCNLACTYCRRNNQGTDSGPTRRDFDRVVEVFLEGRRAAVFKVSGYGEAALWPPLVEALRALSNHFPSLQVMTNGTMSKKIFDDLIQIDNLGFCVTLDGLEPEENRHRCHGNLTLHRRILDFVRQTVEAGKGLEINCVVTSHNIEQLLDYEKRLRDRYSNAVKLIPFPVRPFVGLDTEKLYPSNDQIARFEKSLALAHDADLIVFPPRAYLRRIVDFMRGRNRTTGCYLPAANYGVGPAMKPLLCACAGHTQPSKDYLNVRYENESINRRIRVGKLGIVSPQCAQCFNHYEIVNMFVEGVLSTEDLRSMPVFDLPGVQAQMLRMRAQVMDQ